MNRLTTTALLLTVAASATITRGQAAGRPAPATRPATAHPIGADRAALDKWFAELLTDATLVGSFNAGNDRAPREDRYTILKAVKGEGENWTITAKIEYRGFSLPVDLAVPVRWAGDTPMIQLTDYAVPGFGTFTARVMFFGNEYAGTWGGANHGGLMWGRIEHAAKPATRPAAAKT